MTTRLFLSVLIGLFALTAQGAGLFFQHGNATNGLPYLSEITLTPTNLPAVINGVIVVNDSLRFKLDASGQLTLTNVYPLRYKVHSVLAGKNTVTDYEITLTNALSDPTIIAASTIITAPTNSSASGSVAYSMAAANALFYLNSNPSNYTANGVPLYGASATTNVGLLAYNIYHTNNVLAWSPLVIAGASVSAFNGTYVLSSSNFVSGLARVIWTNSTSSKILYLNDPGANVFGLSPMLESMPNDPNGYYSGSEGLDSIPAAPFSAFAGAPGDTITITYVTNAIVTALQVGRPTNFVFASTSPNIWVDQVNGRDDYANRTNGIPFATFLAACAVATNNDIINAVTANYGESSLITVPTNVTINFNHSWITNVGFTFSSGNKINDLNTFYAPHFACTNTNSVTVIRNLYSYGASGDGILIDTNNSQMFFWDSDLGSPWDAAIIQGTSTNSYLQFNNVRFASVANPLQPMTVTWGFHAIGWAIGPNGGGKLELNNCTLFNLNSASTTFTGTFMLGNSCIQICNTGSGTNFHNASAVLNNCTLSYGSTNAGVVAVGITNTLGIPISGSYLSSTGAVSVAAPPLATARIILDPVTANGIGITNLNASSLASGTVPDARFPATLPAASGANLTALNGSQITSGTVPIARIASGTPDGTKFVRDDSTLVTIASAPTPSYFPSPSLPGSSYAKNRLVQMEYPNASGLGTFGMSPPSGFNGTPAPFPPVAGLPLGVQYPQPAGGICGVNLATPTTQWSTNSMNVSWDVSFTTDVSSNRIWCCISSLAPAGADQPFRCFGFRRSHTFPDAGWVAYSNDSTVTNNIATGVSVAIGTYYHLAIAKTNTSLTYYINGAQVATATWNPTPLAVRENWSNNALNSQATGIVLHNYYNDYTP